MWIRRWFTLTNEQNLRYWPSPEDEENNIVSHESTIQLSDFCFVFQPPAGEIDLHHCIDQTVSVLQRETCARPHTFELRIAVPLKKSNEYGQNEDHPSSSIIAQPFGKRTLYRYWLSADSREDRNDWCNILNQILGDLREWEVNT